MLVGAFACAHTPQLLARPETEDRDLVLRVHAAFARVKRRLTELRPDAIAVVAGDHIAHYRFPPARAYRLNRCLYALESDAGFRRRFLADRPGALAELGLAEEEQRAILVLESDRDAARAALVALGAHPYLVFMAALRLEMERGTTSTEHF